MIFCHLFVAMLLSLVTVSPTSAQDCQSETAVPSTTPTNRFTINGDGTVTDTATGLMWARCPEGLSGTNCATGSIDLLRWDEALTRARDATLAGYADWRLPNIKELFSLVEERCNNPAINIAVFPNERASSSSTFWSASPDSNSANYAWNVQFYYGYVYNYPRVNAYKVLLVRSVP